MREYIVEKAEGSGMNRRNDLLKLIAMVTMAIDHIGVLLLPQLIVLRVIGRIAFPIFAYQLAIGFTKTHNRKRYLSRLFLFGALAQWPYMYLNYEFTMEPFHFNVMLFFAYALLMLWLWEKKQTFLAAFMIVLPEVVIHSWPSFAFSYSTYGLVMILLFYLFMNNSGKMLVAYTVLTVAALLVTGNAIQALSYFGMMTIVTLQYRESAVKLNKWVGYVFYPAHIALLCLIRILL